MLLFIYFWLHWLFITACRLSLVAMIKSYPLVMHGLTVVASPVEEHGLQARGISSCDSQV